MRRFKVAVTTAADGTVTGYSPRVSGEVHAIHYAKGDFADGVDFTITSEATGESLWTESNVNASASRYPRVPTHSTAGAAALYAAGGVGVLARPGLGGDRVKIVIAQGGAVKTGVFQVVIAD